MTDLERDYRLVYTAMGPGHDKDREYLADKYNMPTKSLGDLNTLGAMLFAKLGPAQKATDLIEVEAELSRAASALGRKGRAVNSPAQQQAARDNGKKGGRPKTARKG